MKNVHEIVGVAVSEMGECVGAVLVETVLGMRESSEHTVSEAVDYIENVYKAGLDTPVDVELYLVSVDGNHKLVYSHTIQPEETVY